MIKVDRNKVKMPDGFGTDPGCAASKETNDAKAYFERKAAERLARANGTFKEPPEDAKAATDKKGRKNGKKEDKFEFKVYTTAKPALEKLFLNKCGYCEIDYGGAASDVEHFRPKGGIDYLHEGIKKTHPEGYYWLGADWDNLIYSCQHCNREETHEHQDREGAKVVKRVSGKGNFFPLSEESKRLKPCDPVDDEEEYRLLLDPCRDDPSKHLLFHANGFVTAKSIDGKPSLRGKESIHHYGLSRSDLRGRRQRTANKLLYVIGRLKAGIAKVKADPSGENWLDVAEAARVLRTEFLAPHQPFLAMAWQLFRDRVTRDELKSILPMAQPRK